MEIDRDKAIKLVIVVIGTLAALAVMSTLVQLIQAVLPFIIVAAGVYVGYRWALDDSSAPTADEVEEQARGIFSRFRKTKEAVETTVKVGSMLNNLGGSDNKKESKKEKQSDVVQGEAVTVKAQPKATTPVEKPEATVTEEKDDTTEKINEMKRTIESDPDGQIEFKDRDVVISKDDFATPDISRLEEKEKEVPQVNDNVLSQIEERRRRLNGGG